MQEIQYGIALYDNPENKTENLIGKYVAPIRRSYKHLKCGSTTSCPEDVAKTLAKHPCFYDLLYCITCRDHFPIKEFFWKDDCVQVGKISMDEKFDFTINDVKFSSSSCAIYKNDFDQLIEKEFPDIDIEYYKLYILDENDEIVTEVKEGMKIELFNHNKFRLEEI